MDLAGMHVWFRQYAQQMGMQNVRAILPEQIDLLINTAISDIVNQIIKDHVFSTNDRVITDNSKLGSINSLMSLYKVAELKLSPEAPTLEETRTLVFSSKDRRTGKMTTNFNKVGRNNVIPDYLFISDFSISYKGVSDNQGYTGKDTQDYYLTPQEAGEGTKDNPIAINSYPVTIDYNGTPMTFNKSNGFLRSTENNKYLSAAEYPASSGIYRYVLLDNIVPGTLNVFYTGPGYVQPTFTEDAEETNYYPVRIIDDRFLADTLNDFVLRPRFRSPIITVHDNQFDLYIDEFKKHIVSGQARYTLLASLVPFTLRMGYVAKPRKVEYRADIPDPNNPGQTLPNIDCDLPDHMHVDILKHAVDLYRISVSGALNAQQNQQTNQQRENIRNNARDEGYQQQ